MSLPLEDFPVETEIWEHKGVLHKYASVTGAREPGS